MLFILFIPSRNERLWERKKKTASPWCLSCFPKMNAASLDYRSNKPTTRKMHLARARSKTFQFSNSCFFLFSVPTLHPPFRHIPSSYILLPFLLSSLKESDILRRHACNNNTMHHAPAHHPHHEISKLFSPHYLELKKKK
ncbi:unnamed protein product [Periconia digitata]|uniref:Uncharacterized protein n=1 Tax=Periconia digitata TaxID=1303443 RepID=A0A9W4UQX5_9PLEO|nr:unnamed protein product [Periconia digitata]